MLPKIDLHCHLDGSLSETTIRKLAQNSGILLPNQSQALIQMLSAPRDCDSLAAYLQCFDLPVSCLQTKENLYEAAKRVILEAAGEGVIYIEVRFAPLRHTEGGLSTADVIESVVSGADDGVSAVRAMGKMMAAGVIVCGMRHMPVSENVEMLRTAYDFWKHGVCGVDIAGGEVGFPPMVQKELFDLANDMGMPITIHAGECHSVSNVIDAVHLGAKRIGHGIALCQDAKARQWIKGQGVVLEMCPTSNLQTKAVDAWENYPFRMFMDDGLKVTVNTDNRMVSGTTMVKEMAQLREHCGLTDEEEEIILRNSIDAAFAADEVKAQLLRWVKGCKQ